MERSSKHGFRLDDQMSAETESLVRSGHESRVEEFREMEPAGEDQPIPDTRLAGSAVGDVEGDDELTTDEREARAELAAHLGKEIWPANRQTLEDVATEDQAPAHILAMLRRLPDGQVFENLQAVWTALGGHTEQRF